MAPEDAVHGCREFARSENCLLNAVSPRLRHSRQILSELFKSSQCGCGCLRLYLASYVTAIFRPSELSVLGEKSKRIHVDSFPSSVFIERKIEPHHLILQELQSSFAKACLTERLRGYLIETYKTL